MIDRMRLAFVKMHGLGNDFIVFDAPPAGPLPGAAQLRDLADRHTGIEQDEVVAEAVHLHEGEPHAVDNNARRPGAAAVR